MNILDNPLYSTLFHFVVHKHTCATKQPTEGTTCQAPRSPLCLPCPTGHQWRSTSGRVPRRRLSRSSSSSSVRFLRWARTGRERRRNWSEPVTSAAPTVFPRTILDSGAGSIEICGSIWPSSSRWRSATG